jgi:ferritin-like protein
MRATRRQLVGGAAVAALAAARPAQAAGGSDIEQLERLLSLEQRLEAAYGLALERSAIDLRLGRLLLGHEQEHVRALGLVLRNRGSRAPRATAPRPQAGAAFASRRAFANFALGLEHDAVAAYEAALPRFRDRRLLRPLASIMGAGAQHEVALRQELGLDLATGA